ncbi:MAG: aminomethyltransferase family protein, partial [Pseudomonadota bacterium]
MSESTRQSALAPRHTALGSGLEDWNGMGTAWTYNTDPDREHDAVREAAGLFDMSPLKKVWVRGADATAVVDASFSRDCRAIPPGKAAYGSVLSERGTVADDAIAFNCGDQGWLFVHGSGDSMAMLTASGAERDASIVLDDDLHNIAVQGPLSLELVNAHATAELGALRYFEHVETQLCGHPCRISRTGYSGERGYEVFVGSDAVLDVWDTLLASGAAQGVMPCSFTALDKVRIEAALLFYGYDMTDAHSPFEVGLGFTLASNGEYRGKQAAFARRGAETIQPVGLVVAHDDALAGGETLMLDGQVVGTVNSPAYSHRLGQSLALGHASPEAA